MRGIFRETLKKLLQVSLNNFNHTKNKNAKLLLGGASRCKTNFLIDNCRICKSCYNH